MNKLTLVPTGFRTTVPNEEVAKIVRQALIDQNLLPEGIDPETVTVAAGRGVFNVAAEAIREVVENDG